MTNQDTAATGADTTTNGTTTTTNPDVGGITLDITDESVVISMTGGATWDIPLGPVTLAAGELRSDPPKPADLTNALGFVHDYFDDIVGAAPSVLASPSVAAVGRHARAVAAVEIGSTALAGGYRLRRVDADEVFRTVVAEPRAQRLHNPGLDPADVDTIIGTLCILLAIMRRMDLTEMSVLP